MQRLNKYIRLTFNVTLTKHLGFSEFPGNNNIRLNFHKTLTYYFVHETCCKGFSSFIVNVKDQENYKCTRANLSTCGRNYIEVCIVTSINKIVV